MLKRTALILALPLFLAACAGTAETRSLNALAIACDSYATALGQAAAHKASMSEGDIARVDTVNELIDPVCMPDSTIDPRDGVKIVRGGLDVLKTIEGVF